MYFTYRLFVLCSCPCEALVRDFRKSAFCGVGYSIIPHQIWYPSVDISREYLVQTKRINWSTTYVAFVHLLSLCTFNSEFLFTSIVYRI